MSLPEAIAARIERVGDCWLWRGPLHPLGYGMAYHERRQHFAHRLVYALLVQTPGKRQLHHRCPNRACVNPDHLELVTPRQHSRRHARTHCQRGHELTPANVYYYQGRPHACRACRKIHRRAYLDRQHQSVVNSSS